MMRDLIDFIGINLEYGKKLVHLLSSKSSSFDTLRKERKEKLNSIVASGHDIIQAVLANINNLLEKEKLDPSLLSE